MPTSTNVTNLKINELTEAQYDTAVQNNVIGENELSVITDLDDAIQVDTMPTAAAGELGKVYQFIGTTDANYTHGYFYECTGAGSPVVYSWTQLNVQPGGSSLPSQTGNSGKFLTTDGTDASWGSINALQNTFDTTKHQSLKVTYTSQGSGESGVVISDINVSTAGVAIGTGISQSNALGTGVVIGSGARANATIGNDSGVVIGSSAQSTAGIAIGTSAIAGKYCLAIGFNAQTTVANNFQGAIQIGAYNYTNTDANTVKIANANGNFEIMSADGTIPTDRYTTTPSADGTYVPTLTISSGVATRTWSAPSGGGGSAPTTTTATLATTGWTLNSQTSRYEKTVSVTGVTASNLVQVAPAPASQTDYSYANVMCIAQGAGTLTFDAATTPSNSLTVNVVIFS